MSYFYCLDEALIHTASHRETKFRLIQSIFIRIVIFAYFVSKRRKRGYSFVVIGEKYVQG